MDCSRDNFIPMVFSSGTVLRLSSTGYIRRHLTLGSIDTADGELLFEGGLVFRFLDSSRIRSTDRLVSSSMIASPSLKLNPSPNSVSYASCWPPIAQQVALFGSFLIFLLFWWPVVFFRQVVGLGQTARVQRGPSEAARCASNGTALLPALPLFTPATSPHSTPSPKTSTHTAS